MGIGHVHIFSATILAFIGAALAILSATLGPDKMPWTVSTLTDNSLDTTKVYYGLQSAETCASSAFFGTTVCSTASYSSSSDSTTETDCYNAGQTAMSTMIVGGGISMFGVALVILFFCECCIKFRVTVFAWAISCIFYAAAIGTWSNKCVSDLNNDLPGDQANGNGVILAIIALVATFVAIILQLIECFWFRVGVVSYGLMRL